MKHTPINITEANPIKAIFNASRGGYETVLEAARQLDANRPIEGVDDMYQWTGRNGVKDPYALDRTNARINIEIRKTLQLHPHWPVVEAIIIGLEERQARLQQDYMTLRDATTIAQSQKTQQRLRSIIDDLDKHIMSLDHIFLEATTAPRRNLDDARTSLKELMAQVTAKQEVSPCPPFLMDEYHDQEFLDHVTCNACGRDQYIKTGAITCRICGRNDALMDQEAT